MTEPQELRSIDELFKNTFDNLPDTPAQSGWDSPSERVWDHVRHNIQAPRSGWNLQSLMVLAGFAVVLAVGLYYVFSGRDIPATTPVETSTPIVATPNHSETTAAPAPMPEKAVAVAPVAVQKTKKKSAPRYKSDAGNTRPAVPVAETPVNTNREMQRSNGAAPLPGSRDVKIPNTTEALKIEHAKQLEQLWKTPLDFLPVPGTKTANN